MADSPNPSFSLKNAAQMTGLMGLALDAEPSPHPTSGSGRFVPPSVEELSQHFPELEILERVGLGGMGCVYKARQKHLDRLVALKILPSEFGNNPRSKERFAREARALAKLVHPNIVTIHDFGEAADMHFLVMEYMDGMSLRELMDADRLSPQQCVDIMLRTCAALQYAHGSGVVHRDIKPENILFDRHGHLKIADFGLAKLATETSRDITLTGSRQAMGTLHYMAPEQWESPGSVDHRADVYALGVLMYEMTTGRLPLGRFDPPSLAAGAPEPIDDIVMNSMHRDPERRFDSAAEIMERLCAVDGEQSTRASNSQVLEAPVSMDDSGAGTFTRIVNVGDRMRRWIRESPDDTPVVSSMKGMIRRAADEHEERRLMFPTGTFILCIGIAMLSILSWAKVPVLGNSVFTWQNGIDSGIRYESFSISNIWLLAAAGGIFVLTCFRNRLRFRADFLSFLLAAYGVTHVVFFLITSFSDKHNVVVTAAPFLCGGMFALMLLDRLLAMFLGMCTTVMAGARSLPWDSWVDGMKTANDRIRAEAARQNAAARRVFAEHGASASSNLASASFVAGRTAAGVIRTAGRVLKSVARNGIRIGKVGWSARTMFSKKPADPQKNSAPAANEPPSP